jgi:hypothetical protein
VLVQTVARCGRRLKQDRFPASSAGIGLWAKALSAFCSHFERLHLGVGGRRHLLRLGGGAFRCGMLRSASAQSR